MRHLVDELGEAELVSALRELLRTGVFRLSEQKAKAKFPELFFDQMHEDPVLQQHVPEVGDAPGFSAERDGVEDKGSDGDFESDEGGSDEGLSPDARTSLPWDANHTFTADPDFGLHLPFETST